MSTMYAQTVTMSAAGASTAFVVKPPASQSQGGSFGPGYLPPAILASVSTGAVLAYNIEVSGDNVNFVPFTNASGLTGAFCDTLGAAVKFIRINVTSYTSGSAVFQFIQQVE